MSRAMKISEKGLKALKESDGMNPKHVLVLEVVSRTNNITQENAIDLCNQLIKHCGSIEAAITAIRSGLVDFVKDN